MRCNLQIILVYYQLSLVQTNIQKQIQTQQNVVKHLLLIVKMIIYNEVDYKNENVKRKISQKSICVEKIKSKLAMLSNSTVTNQMLPPVVKLFRLSFCLKLNSPLILNALCLQLIRQLYFSSYILLALMQKSVCIWQLPS